MDPLDTLKKIPSVVARIEEVANDLESHKDQYSEIDPYTLAELLGLCPEEFESRTTVGNRISFGDYEAVPLHNYLSALEGMIPQERLRKLKELSEAFEAGFANKDAELTNTEREIVEVYLTREEKEKGSNAKYKDLTKK